MKYVRQSGAKRLDLYEDKHCTECDETHAVKVNEVLCSSKVVETHLARYIGQGYEKITSFEMLDRITKDCSGDEEDD